jgi:hypothetical protein
MIKKIVDYIGSPDNSAKLKKMLYISLVVIVISDIVVYVLHLKHAHYTWDNIPGWGAFYGFVSCVLIILVSKFIGKQGGVMKKEDYYDKQE